MKKINKLLIIIVTTLVVSLAFPLSVSAASLNEDRTVFGSSYTLESGRILNGDLNVIGGVVEIKEDATVNGDMFVLGGLVNIDGTVQGTLSVVGGTVTLEAHAVIEGDLISPASYVTSDPGAIIQGDQIEDWNIPWNNFDLPTIYHPALLRTPGVHLIPVLTRIGRGAAFMLLLVALGALMLLVMPKSADNMTAALIIKPWPVLGYGALTALVMLFGGIILTITICLIPVVILVGLAFGLAVLAGWLTLGYELGKRIAASIFKTTWHPVLSAALGNLVLYLVASGLDLIPCLGGFLVFIAMLFGLGMAVVTLFGTNAFPRKETVEKDELVILNEIEETVDPTILFIEETAKGSADTQQPIEVLGLGTRTTNVLKDAGLKNIDDILNRFNSGEDSILDINGFGRKSLNDLKNALQQMGYSIPRASE